MDGGKKETERGSHIITCNPSEVQWDESQMRRRYANRSTAAYNREEISILLGVEQVRQAGVEEIRVELTNRIVMRPLIAKQFAILLNETVKKYEGIWGTIEPPLTAPALSTVGKPGVALVGSGEETSAEKARAFIRPISEFDIEIAVERSFKAFKGQLLDKRFLLGINCKDLEDGSAECLEKICRAIGMPQNMLTSFMKYLPDANHIYFGFEENEQTIVYKGYLEFRDKIQEKLQKKGTGSEPFLLYLGLKWDLEDSTRQSITRYEWFPLLPVPDILSRLRLTLDPKRHGGLLELTSRIVNLAAEKISCHDIQYLEVSEEGNPRKSFDINIYKAGFVLKEKDLYPLFLNMMAHYGIPFEKFEGLYEKIQNDRLGHLAGGVDRKGRDFFTVYHGVKYLPGQRLTLRDVNFMPK